MIIVPALFLTAATAHAESAGVKNAIEAIEVFYTETETITKEFSGAGPAPEIIVERDKSIKALKEIKWSEAPSQRRAERVIETVESFMNSAIGHVHRQFGSGDGRIKRLYTAKESILTHLKETLETESLQKNGRKTVPPVMERLPQEKEVPGGPTGVYDR